MSFKLLIGIILLNFVCVAFSAVGISLPSTNPDHPGKCWYSESKKAYTPGDVYTAPHCMRVTCNSDFSFDYATCGVIAAEPPCHVVDGDLSLKYPNCCPKIECD